MSESQNACEATKQKIRNTLKKNPDVSKATLDAIDNIKCPSDPDELKKRVSELERKMNTVMEEFVDINKTFLKLGM